MEVEWPLVRCLFRVCTEPWRLLVLCRAFRYTCSVVFSLKFWLLGDHAIPPRAMLRLVSILRFHFAPGASFAFHGPYQQVSSGAFGATFTVRRRTRVSFCKLRRVRIYFRLSRFSPCALRPFDIYIVVCVSSFPPLWPCSPRYR